MIKAILPCLLSCVLTASALPVAAQTGDPFPDHFEQLLRRMDQQMGRGISPDSLFSRGDFWNIAPDSSFFFRFDTIFQDGGAGFFQHRMFIDPFDIGNGGLDRLLEDFFRQAPPPGQEFPADDGDAPGDLLPEERLRNTPQPQPGKSSKRATIRI